MATWKSRGLRGSTLEDMINHMIEDYRKNGLALIQKVPTPITPIEIDQHTRHITLAYFDKKSTVDYIGVVQGIPVCFDAKECSEDTFPLQNLHPHQVEFMRDFEKQSGIAFLIIFYVHRQEYYYMTFREMSEFWSRAENGGRKSIRYEELNPSHFLGIEQKAGISILRGIQRDLDEREDKAQEAGYDG